MQKKETAIEVKVGALFLFSVALLVAFVLVLGDFSFSDGFEFNVEFDNAGGLKPGADVAIAGINVGTVEELRFIRNEEEQTQPEGYAVAVRAKLRVEKKYADAIREDSDLFITTRGVLGEPYIEIVTTDFESPQIDEGAVLRGVDPPRMDLIVAKASELLTVLTDLLDDPDIHAKDLLANTASLMKNLDNFVVDNRGDLDTTVDNVRDGSEEAKQLLAALNVAVEDGEALRATMRDARSTARHAKSIAARVDRDIDPVVDDVVVAAANARNVSESADRLVSGNEAKLNAAVENVHASTENLHKMSDDAQVLVTNVSQGKGTVGALISDREIYDDLKEMLRVIKQRPWKIVWKE
jgi:phospholipid/cholesterol/gamma-HCH transport system substrate-binding protein